MKGYEKLKTAVERDCKVSGCFNPDGCNSAGNSHCTHRYCDQFKWVIDRAKHYGENLGLDWHEVLNSWEATRTYWYMNYYQEYNQPQIAGNKMRVFETVEEMLTSIGKDGFRCAKCDGVTTNPYSCNSGLEMSKGTICDWKVFGLFGDLGKGIYVYCKDKLRGERIFMPIAWETTPYGTA